MGRDTGDGESVCDVGGKRNCNNRSVTGSGNPEGILQKCIRTSSAREQFTQEDTQRVEPVQRLGFGTMRDAFIVIALAEIPESNLVEIMQPDRPGNTVDQKGIGNGHGDDMGQIEPHEVGLAHDGTIGDISDAYKQQEDPSNQIEQRPEEPVREDRRFFSPGNRRTIWLGSGLVEEGHMEMKLACPNNKD